MKGSFIQDQDCHWYFIPEDKKSLFYQMEENGEFDYFCEFNNTFEEYRCEYPSNYVVEMEVVE